MCKVTVLVSTMNRNNLGFLKRMNLKTPAIIVNQLPGENLETDDIINKHTIKLINTQNRGASNSRNLLINHACNDISIFADDDVQYYDNYSAIIETAYKLNPSADLICFQVNRTGSNSKLRSKKFSSRRKWLGYLTSMKVSAIEITFRTKSLKDSGVRFNPNIGTGTEFLNGEENQFLFDCLKAGLNILYVPIEIASVDLTESTWFRGYNEDYFISTGAKFYNMTPTYYHALILQFALRKRKLYAKRFSFKKVVELMYDGVKLYKEKHGEK